MTTTTIRWDGSITATTSIAHGGDTRGIITLLRRERLILPDGQTAEIPIISGNTLRGRLRRTAEELLRDVLNYEGTLSTAAAHAIRGGGALTKTGGEPLSGSRLHQVRELLPVIAVFGAAAGGRIIDGCLSVGKVIPYLSETSHITGVASQRTALTCTQLETYSRQDDSNQHAFPELLHPDTADDVADTPQKQFRIETFPAGTRFRTWLQLNRATPAEQAFFVDVLTHYGQHATLGGRTGIGLGQVQLDLAPNTPPAKVDWRTPLLARRDDALSALAALA